MRICYVTHAGAHFSAPYVEYFAARGHDVHVISAQAVNIPNATNHRLVRGKFDPYRAHLIYFRLLFKVRALIRRIQPDLVHAHHVTSNGLMAAASGFHPLVISARGSDIHQAVNHAVKRRLVKYALRRADLVNPVSRELERKILDLGIAAGKILRLTQGIDCGRFAVDRPESLGAAPQVISTRKLYPIYQPDMVVEALARVAHEKVAFRFLFAATGPLESALRERVAALGLGKSVRFGGGFTVDELPGMLAASDVYVSASQWDGTSPALLEAMAAGIFPVVTDIPANREWVTGAGDGHLVPVGNPVALANALAQAIRDHATRQTARPILQARVRAEGDRKTNLARLEQAYLELAGRGGRR